jgi:hypothetical protein
MCVGPKISHPERDDKAKQHQYVKPPLFHCADDGLDREIIKIE